MVRLWRFVFDYWGKVMEKKLKIDPKKVEYDGHSFRLIINDEAALLERLKEKQAKIIKDLEKEQFEDQGSRDQAARGARQALKITKNKRVKTMTKFQKERIEFLIKEANKGTFVQLGRADADILFGLIATLADMEKELNNTQVLLDGWKDNYFKLKQLYEE